ncbi:MAG: TRAP transporter TatT component family protein [Methylovulum sp.]|nr:TRAP transporter TatT component family protein [Methylovulum sp.]
MKNILFVVLLLLSSTHCLADNLQDALQGIETEWASIYYGTPRQLQGSAYATLLDKTVKLSRQYPKDTNALFWQAVVKASYADRQDPVSALAAIYEVRDLLNKIITINPTTMNGSAYVVLGTLYHKAPAWPIAFGDDEKASKSFQAALKISPDGMDSNYYYGEFLLANNPLKDAEIYFKKASVAPVRATQQYADTQLQNAAKRALNTLGLEKSASTTP